MKATELEQEGFKIKSFSTVKFRGVRTAAILTKNGKEFVAWSFNGAEFTEPVEVAKWT